MKMNVLRTVLLGILFVCLCSTSGCISTRRFQTGFHMGLGMQAAQALVGTAVGALNGIAGTGAGGVPRNSGWGRACASPYEEAYAREAARLQRERYERWVRAERERGRADALRDAGRR